MAGGGLHPLAPAKSATEPSMYRDHRSDPSFNTIVIRVHNHVYNTVALASAGVIA